MRSNINIVDKECAVQLDPFLLVRVGMYKLLFTSKSAVVIELEKEHLDSEEWVASFEKQAKKEKVLSELFSNCVLIARFMQLLSDTYSL